jgi:hypothetical protein
MYSITFDYMFLTCSVYGVYSHPSHLNRRERYLGRFGTWGWERRLRAGANVARVRGSTWVSVRPHYRGLPPKLAGRGQAAARNRREPSPRKRGPRLLRRDGTSEGVAVASISRRSGKQAAVVTLPRCAFRRSASLFCCRGRFTEPTFTRRDLRAAMTLVWRKSVGEYADHRADKRDRRRYINRARHVRAFGVWIWNLK